MKFKLFKKIFRSPTGRDLVYAFIDGQGTPLVFLNGLSDSMESWVETLRHANITRPCLLVDLPGQGSSLELELQKSDEFQYQLSIEEQVEALTSLLGHLSIREFGLVGFSYGGGVALGMLQEASSQVKDLILLMPFILRLDLSFPLSRLWAAQFELMKSMTPRSLRQPYLVLEKSYERFVEHYMNFRYLKRIPEERHRQVAVELSRGIMEFNSFSVIPQIPDERLILITSGLDTLVPQSLYQEFWYRIPEHKKQSWVNILNGDHLILEQAPETVAQLLSSALQGELHGVKKITLSEVRTSSAI
ncbi:alpha/beta fold hydrolase [Bdellovibrio sp.]|uniref:alpha/beta fold hydrolase n=1 Tax=Bdellovibrio sp. TaxID=28201 RepID=UPI0039E4EDFB